MKKLLFFMVFGLAFLAGLHLGKRKIWRRYPSVSVKVGSDIAEFNAVMDRMQASLEYGRGVLRLASQYKSRGIL